MSNQDAALTAAERSFEDRETFLGSNAASTYLIAAHRIAVDYGGDKIGELKDEIAWAIREFDRIRFREVAALNKQVNGQHEANVQLSQINAELREQVKTLREMVRELKFELVLDCATCSRFVCGAHSDLVSRAVALLGEEKNNG